MKKIIIFTGAGISAPSGISTFSGDTGLWNNHDLDIVCNRLTWKKNRSIVFDFYNDMRVNLNNVLPNNIHNAIAEIQSTLANNDNPVSVQIVTQNIDNLLEVAGCKNILHIHGNLNEMLCTACKHVWPIDLVSIDKDSIRCPKCNSNKGVKPNVVFYYDTPKEYLVMGKMFKGLTSEDTLIVLGTMGKVIDINGVASDIESFKILNNIEESKFINAENFDKVFYENGIEAIDKIKEILYCKYL